MKYNLSFAKTFSVFCTYCFAYLLFFADVMTIYQKHVIYPIYLIGIPVLLLILILLEKICYRFTTYIFLHFLLAVGLFFIPLPSVLYRILFYFLLTIESIRDYYLWMHHGYKPYQNVPWILISFTTISYICSVIYHAPELSTIAYITALVIMVFHFIQLCLAGLDKQLTQPGNTTSIPFHKIMLTNTTIVGIFIIVFVLTSLFFHIFNLEFLLYDIGTAIRNVLRFLAELFVYVLAFLRALFARNTEAIVEKEEHNKNMMNAFQTASNTSLWAEIAMNLCKIAAFGFILFCLYRTISSTLRTYMTKYISETDEITNIEHKETIKKKKKTNAKRPIETLRDYLANDFVSKIRRAYRTKIRQYKDIQPKVSDTANDLEKRVKDHYQENIHDLTKVYQKARYSNEPITNEDLTKASSFPTH